ncbi:MAG: HlyD family efflux transporter periplasmic adaptor subunit, partial [Acidobacteria bacterium]
MPILRHAVLLILVGLPLFACGKEAAEPPKAAEPPVVRDATVATVAAAELEEASQVTGTVRSRTTTTLSSKIVGRILALHVREGSMVQAGQLLIELDDQDFAAQTRRAEAGLREAEAAMEEVERGMAAAAAGQAAAEAQRDLAASTLVRYQRLMDRKAVAPQEYDQVAAQQKAAAATVDRAIAEGQAIQSKRAQVLARIETARTEIASTQVMRGHAKIAAPFAGIVTTKHAERGGLAAPGAPVLTVEDNRRYWLEIAVPDSQVGGLKRSQSLRVAVEGAGVSGSATISEIVPTADQATRTTLVRLDLPASPQLRSGLFGRAWIPAGRRHAIQVAREAVVERGQLQGVYVVGQDDVARFRLIRTGAT